ncbi:MAG: aminoacyl-histidine dipeptidase [Lachnospiraceae bacterium]|nr:aminoacyl-histidine dipeptidase [Lachnospiraceae bacterium]
MNNSLNLEPQNVFGFFEQLAKIPRGSGNTKEVSDYLANFAKERGLTYYQDDNNNIIIIKEASVGYEASEPIIIQGHIDMVLDQTSTCTKDLNKEGLDLYVDGDFLKAKDTTLGGDDGIAVAYALALLDDDSLCHPRLEAVFTSDEETTMLGVQTIDVSPLKGHILLNIDSDEDGVFLTSSAGGCEIDVTIPVKRTGKQGTLLTISMEGLLGGHSGAEINKERVNSAKLSARLLWDLERDVDYQLVSFEAGSKHNIIARTATVAILVDTNEVSAVCESIRKNVDIYKEEYRTSDPDLKVNVAKEEGQYEVLDPTSQRKVMMYLYHTPFGVQYMSTEIENLVETSVNVGIVSLKEDELYVCSSVRSSVTTRRESVFRQIQSLGEFLGGEVEITDSYPAWQYNPESTIRSLIMDTYKDLFHEDARMEAVHAGLECGYFNEKIKDLDCVSFGPTNYDIHSTKERLSISSTQKYWKFLVELLKRAK